MNKKRDWKYNLPFFILCAMLGTQACLMLSLHAHASAQVNVLSHNGFIREPEGFYQVVGELENTGDVNLNFINVTVAFYDTAGEVLGTSTTPSMIKTLLPGRKAPFSTAFLEEPGEYVAYHDLISVNFTEYAVEVPLGLQIVSSSHSIDANGRMNVSGELKNIGNEKATNARVVATFHNGSGGVVAVTNGFLEGSLTYDVEPGQTVSFKAYLAKERVPLVASYSLATESDQYASVLGEPPTPIPDTEEPTASLVAKVNNKNYVTAFTVNSDTIITFDGSGSTDNIGITSYKWDFGDGATAMTAIANHTYTNLGTYTVQLTVEDAAGNNDIRTIKVTVENIVTENSPLPYWIIVGLIVIATLILVTRTRFRRKRFRRK